jgi:hypothetical protein
MSGSPTVGAWLAQIAFWILLLQGWRELGSKWIAIFVALWIGGIVLRGYLLAGLFTPYVAVLAIIVVFMVHKRDVRLT